MSISGISTAALQSILQQQTGTTTSNQTALPSGTGGYSGSSAYTLSLGQQQAETSLLGYGQLGKLVSQAEGALAGMDRDNPAATATLGNGQTLGQTYTVDVQQLAQAEVLTSPGYSDPSQVIGTGTLTLQGGSYDAATDTFSPTGNSTTISITDGSLTGIAQAINGADIGLTAQVVTGADGQSSLQINGPTGADNAFTMSGIPGLTYDPANPSFTDLEATQTAQDAVYSVNGAAAQTSPGNTDVPVAAGLVTTLTATGTTTVTAPAGQSQAVGAANALVTAVNTLLSGLGGLTASGGDLAGDSSGVASQLVKALEQVAGQSFSGTGTLTSLSAIGITAQSDGTLAVDQSTLQGAYAADPTATRALLDQAARAIQQVLGGTQGAGDQIKSQMQAFAEQMIAMPSLADLLGQSQSGTSSSQSSDPFGLSSGTGGLASMLQSSPGLATALSQSSQGQSLLASLGYGSTGSSSTGSSGTGSTATGSTASSSLTQLLDSLGTTGSGSKAGSSASSLAALLASLGTSA